MGIFDRPGAGLFKKSVTGQLLFFPWGALGKGYALESEAQAERIRSFLKRYYAVALSAIGIVAVTVGTNHTLVLLPVLLIWYHLGTTQGLEPLATSERLTLDEEYSARAEIRPLRCLVLAELGALAGVAVGIWMVHDHAQPLLAVAMIGFFGLLAVAGAFMILKKLQS